MSKAPSAVTLPISRLGGIWSSNSGNIGASPVAGGELRRADIQCFLVNSDEDLAPDALFCAAVLAGAKNRAFVSLTTLIDAIRGGNLSVGSSEDAGFSGLRVARAEVDLLSTAPKQLPIGLIPAAAFGVSVGIKGEGRFLALISGAHTTGKVIQHTTIRAAHVYVDEHPENAQAYALSTAGCLGW